MNRFAAHCRILAVLLAVTGSFVASAAVDTGKDGTSPAALLARAEQLRSTDQVRFADILEQLHQEEGRLTPAQRWHLRYLDTSQLTYRGEYAKAEPILRDIIEHSSDRSIAARATASLLQNKYLGHNYEEAYRLAYELVSELPRITDPVARRSALSKVLWMLNGGGQHDLALKYARQIKASFPSDKGQCEGDLSVSQTLLQMGKLTSTSPEIQEAISTCLEAGQVVSANALRLDLADLLRKEGHSEEAIALLNRIAPSIKRAKYRFHVGSLHLGLADAYARLGEDTKARKFALQALADNRPGEVNFVVQDANKILYEVEKRSGHPKAALAWFEKYTEQAQNSADDAKARALAYQMVKQDVLARKMQVEALGKENRILQLRQTVTEKAAETARLYIALLLVVIAFIAFWLYRTKNSQLRFQRLSQRDGMTGAYNRKYFLDSSVETLQRLKKAGVGAALVLLDLDYFKQVNDSFGHAAGDEVLTRTVAICRQELRESDVFGRLGGEEFGILMPACSCEQGEEIADRIRRTLNSARILLDSGTVVKVSASFGLACTSISGYALTHLLSVADAALYRAKRAGRNQLIVGADKDEHPADAAQSEARAIF